MTPFQKRKLEEFRETFVIDNSDYKILCNRLPEPIEDFLLKALQEQTDEIKKNLEKILANQEFYDQEFDNYIKTLK